MENLFAGAGVAVPVQSGTGKRRALESTAESKTENEMLLVTAKLALSSALRSRVLMSATVDAYKVFTDDPIAVAVRKGVKTYTDMAKTLRQEKHLDPDEIQNKIGIPDGSAYNEVTKVLIEHLKQTNPDAAVKVQEAASKWTPGYLAEAVRLLRIEKAFDSKFKKVYVKIVPLKNKDAPDTLDLVQIWTEVEKMILAKPKQKVMRGVAPPGDLERRLQGMIDQAEGKTDKD